MGGPEGASRMAYYNSATQAGVFEDIGRVHLSQESGLCRRVVAVPGKTAREDGVESKWAVYSEVHDVFGYVDIEVTGRKPLYMDGSWGVTVRATWPNGETERARLLFDTWAEAFKTIEQRNIR